MQKNIYFFIFFLCSVLSIEAQVQLGQNIYGLPGTYFGRAVCISENGNRIAAGAILEEGYVSVYDLLGDSLVQVGLPIEGVKAGESFGVSVAMSASGNRIAVGAQFATLDTNITGSVRVFDWNGTHWIQVGPTLYGGSHHARFGWAIDMSADGKRLVIAGRNDKAEGGSGSVSVFEEISGDWIQVGQIIRGASTELIGISVSISSGGHRIAFGKNKSSPSDKGFIRIYEYQNAVWQQVGSDIAGEDEGSETGASVSLSSNGKRVAFGAPSYDGSGILFGRVYIYEEVSGEWLQVGNAIDGKKSQGFFGVDLDLSGNGERLAVGAPFTNGGEVSLYQLKDNTWIQLGEKIFDIQTNDYFGDAVAISTDGKRVVGGGWFNKTVGINCGLMQLYSIPRIVGHVYHDLSLDCTVDNIDPTLPDRFAMIEPGSILVKTDKRGMYNLDKLPAGQYTISFDTAGPWNPICEVTQSFEIPDTASILAAPSMGFESLFSCIRPQISVVMPSITRCFDNQLIYVQVCNEALASATLNDPYIILRLDPNITPLSSTIPFEDLGNLQYRFLLDTLHPGQCESFSINAIVSCDAELGQTLCIESALFPSDTCHDIYASQYHPRPGIACPLPYDGSDLDVSLSCLGDSLQFVISNLGQPGIGDMVCYSQVRIYRDEFLVAIDSIQLAGGTTKSFKKYADGYTWRIEADQHPKYTDWSRPSASIELCGDAQNWTAGLINYFNLNDLDPAFDIYCDQVTGSYDPNDKSAHPQGIGPEHYIVPNQQIEYLIRFQNTGTDTAVNVVIRDTLDKNLDLFSITQGPSSHGHVFNISSPGVLEWYFPNIQLPDSAVNEAASHGFVAYTIRQKINLPEGTTLQNDAAIYFDFNEPIITNTTVHTIQETQLISAVHDQNEKNKEENIKILPNPTTGQFIIEMSSSVKLEKIEIADLHGRLVHTQAYDGQGRWEVNFEAPAGIYFLKLNTARHSTQVMKVIKVE